MRAVIQVVKSSSVVINKTLKKEVDRGLNVLVGFTHDDTKEMVDALVKKIVNLRIFMDEQDKMNLSVIDIKGAILSISQFTLYADNKKGNRPGFTQAMRPDLASSMYDYFNECLKSYDISVEIGEFGADMLVSIENDGPTTIVLDSAEIVKKK